MVRDALIPEAVAPSVSLGEDVSIPEVIALSNSTGAGSLKCWAIKLNFQGLY